MAIAFHVNGPAAIAVGVPTGSSLVSLGYSEEGVDISKQYLDREIKSDLMGGAEGPPAEILALGELIEVTATVNKYDAAVMKSVLGHRSAYGTAPTPGTMLFSGGKTMRLCIQAAGDPINLANAIVVEAPEWNLATIETAYKIKWRGYVTTPGGTLHDASTS